LLLLTSCGSSSKAVPYVDVSSQLRDVQFPRLVRELFRSRAELTGYLGRALPGRKPTAPNIDFGHREAILVATGPRSSSGYALHVVKVRETSDRIAVTVRERTPSLGEPVVPRVTYPFVLITIPRIDKKLLLHIEGRP
jgi:PrcB C-terminal